MSLTVAEMLIPSADFGGESTLPAINQVSNVQALTKTKLDEDDGLFIGYGFLPSLFPYKMQDRYDRGTDKKAYTAVILENKYLKAVFLPELGGRLWSLYDKEGNKDLLYTNTIVRPCNLAVRNAWIAGGIEFNCGMVGHSPFTCSKIYASEARLDDGTPVLRMYEFERIRRAVYQMDFFLPEDSRVLFGRMRIVNPNTETVPMYWWTNMAMPQREDYRNIIAADESYNNEGGVVGKNPVPMRGDNDISYPTKSPVAIDYFWNIPPHKRKYTAYLDRDGKGFFQTSTPRLIGRKLFVWGRGEGGARWQEFLTEDGKPGKYTEIQAGLAHTQYECLPMPPKTAWEWLEAYGALSADKDKVHGKWAEAQAETEEKINGIISEETLEKMLKDTKKAALTPAEKTICEGSSWGRLENMRREKAGLEPLCPHLTFAPCGETEEAWVRLLYEGTVADKSGKISEKPPVSWMLQKEWTELLSSSSDCFEKYLHLAAIYVAEQKLTDARAAIDKALTFSQTAAALFVRSQVERLEGNTEKSVETALYANSLLPEDLSLARHAFREAIESGKNREVIEAYERSPENVKRDGRATMYYAFAILRTGDIEKAEEILHRDGGLSVTDIQEGETSITGLYTEIEKEKAQRAGKTFDADSLSIPRKFDFRMFVPEKK